MHRDSQVVRCFQGACRPCASPAQRMKCKALLPALMQIEGGLQNLTAHILQLLDMILLRWYWKPGSCQNKASVFVCWDACESPSPTFEHSGELQLLPSMPRRTATEFLGARWVCLKVACPKGELKARKKAKAGRQISKRACCYDLFILRLR